MSAHTDIGKEFKKATTHPVRDHWRMELIEDEMHMAHPKIILRNRWGTQMFESPRMADWAKAARIVIQMVKRGMFDHYSPKADVRNLRFFNHEAGTTFMEAHYPTEVNFASPWY